MDEGQYSYITYAIEMVDVKTQADIDKERAEAAAKKGNPEKEDEELQKYFKKEWYRRCNKNINRHVLCKTHNYRW